MAGDLVAETARWTVPVRDSRRHIYTTAKSVAHPDGGAAQSNSPHPQPANYPIFCALSTGHRQICKPAFQTATNVLADLLPNTERRIKSNSCLSYIYRRSLVWKPYLILVSTTAPAVVYFFQAGVLFSKENFGLFWSILAVWRKFTHFLAYFLQALIVWWCTKIEKYEVWWKRVFGLRPHNLNNSTALARECKTFLE